jgi:hypothetical protein
MSMSKAELWKIKDASYREQAKGEYIRGPYLIKRVEQGSLLRVTRFDGKDLPPKLHGYFTDVRTVENLINSL